MLNKYNTFIFDLDGTVYRGDNIIPNADVTINAIKSLGKRVLFISNKTTGTVNDYYLFLKSFGLDIEEDEILNSTIVLKNYLLKNYPHKKFYAIGEQIFIDELTAAGLKYSGNPIEIEIIIVTLDRTLNYEKLEVAAKALENGARFFAANIDDTCPVDGGEVLDAGSTISALEKRTHKKLELHFGKPSDFMMDEIKLKLNGNLSKALLLGDRLETDILMGDKLGIDTALVSTGIKLFENGNSEIKPTYRLESIFDIVK
ncbi:MAG: HAD-IIA family hydrolase [Ignavibacteriaceae bacterium]|nr:HAD-IIA family hydrolase [Ignavibacterium sp.]MCC6256376.1 HAD-IIA family hydrolase [Ignavibacteriaceae bacterium]HMN23699.1 HAD-IIA family hydrolase [Ignavibacteriaceae bacterium]HRN26789.1 HAD-IIA family hydrolase [Ignavibacteriaceae bacterium]HRP93833.1 HAD-IIA family hydrolase [Ignavibacteriaceae bacterium]